jgi:fructose/tagatose bisphosphate aldolase
MVDGSSLSVRDNVQFTSRIVKAAHAKQVITEAELGRLSGTEDDLTIEEYEAHLTDVHQVL